MESQGEGVERITAIEVKVALTRYQEDGEVAGQRAATVVLFEKDIPPDFRTLLLSRIPSAT